MVIKPNIEGKLKFCVEYHWPSASKVPDTYHLPIMNDLLDSLADAGVLITLDGNLDLWQIQIFYND